MTTDARSASDDAQEQKSAVCDPRSTHVLIADDDEGIRETLRFALEDLGYHITEAVDGPSTIQALRETPHRLVVLLDHVMPGIDGARILKTISDDETLARRHACVLITASARVAQLEEQLNTLAHPPVSIVRKPFDLDVLLAAVEQACIRIAQE